MYFQELLPLVATSGDDGNYAQTAANDLSLLQVRYSLDVLLRVCPWMNLCIAILQFNFGRL